MHVDTTTTSLNTIREDLIEKGLNDENLLLEKIYEERTKICDQSSQGSKCFVATVLCGAAALFHLYFASIGIGVVLDNSGVGVNALLDKLNCYDPILVFAFQPFVGSFIILSVFTFLFCTTFGIAAGCKKISNN